MIKSVHHISLCVSDMKRSIRFYTRLGFQAETIREQVTADYFRQIIGYPDAVVANALLRGPDHIRLELMQYIHPCGVKLDLATPNTGSTHICFEVDDIYEMYRQLSKQGVICRTPPVAIPTGPNAGGYALYMLDPDGYTMELIQLPTKL